MNFYLKKDKLKQFFNYEYLVRPHPSWFSQAPAKMVGLPRLVINQCSTYLILGELLLSYIIISKMVKLIKL